MCSSLIGRAKKLTACGRRPLPATHTVLRVMSPSHDCHVSHGHGRVTHEFKLPVPRDAEAGPLPVEMSLNL